MKEELLKVCKRRKRRSLLLRLNTGALVQALLILLFPCFSAAQSEQVILVSCENKTPIDGAYVLDEKNGKVLGYSNQEGRVIVFSENIEWPLNLKIYKMSALDTSIVLTQGKTSVCLTPNPYQLSAFEVISEKENIAESFRSYINNTVSKLKDSDTTHYFSFNWNYTLPDSNWSMSIEGVFKIPYQSYTKFNSGGYASKFCQMEIRLDSGLFNSDFINSTNLNYIASAYLIQSDHLRKRFPFRKRIKDEYIVDKISDRSYTKFIYSRPVKKDWKLLISYPVFDDDSVLVENEYKLELINNSDIPKNAFSYLEEKYRVGYKLIKGELIMSSIQAYDKLKHIKGSISTVEFNASLISEPLSLCEEVFIMKQFNKENLIQLNKLEGYEVILE